MFRNLSTRSYKIYLSSQISLASSFLKKTKVKLELLTDIDLLLTLEKGIKGGLYCSINRYAKANSKYKKIMIGIKNLQFINIGM